MEKKIPNEPPPGYDVATASTSSDPGKLSVPQSRNGIPHAHRRSMEDESRPLPKDWVRQFDAKSGHQFFVDTRAEPPRSIWHHPYDDEQYLETLDPKERDRILHRQPTIHDIEAQDTDDEYEYHDISESHKNAVSGRPTTQSTGKETIGQKMKDKLTGSTHVERVEKRKHQAIEEQRAYESHQRIRLAMQQAIETGQPQLIGKDKEGHDLYIESPDGPGGSYGGGYQGDSGTYRGYNPYTTGPYANPNARFIRPQQQYQRPYGYGGMYGGMYGGGYGYGYSPFMMGGGLLGGMMLGGMLF